MRHGAQGWCTGMTLRDGMGREVGGGFRMGNTCIPVANSCQCMAKTNKKTEYLPVNLLEIVILIFPSLPFKFTGLEIRDI